MKLKYYYSTIIVLAMLFIAPLVWNSSSALNFLIFTLIISLGAIGWNILSGVAGQTSFGHAAFFGVGAYCTSLWQINLSMDALSGLLLAIILGSLVAFIIGFLSFRAGLKGSYFALVTLAFAEVLRVLANSASFTGGAAGSLLEIKSGFWALQFENRIYFYWVVLAIEALALIIMVWVMRSRFGSQLIAIKENEDAAKALGVDILKRKLQAIALSGGMTAAAGALYVQYFLYIDPLLVFSPKMSVEVLLATMVGGIGTVLGPIVGAFSLHFLGEGVKFFTGNVPGVDVAIYGLVLIVAVCFIPRGLLSLFEKKSSLRKNTK